MGWVSIELSRAALLPPLFSRRFRAFSWGVSARPYIVSRSLFRDGACWKSHRNIIAVRRYHRWCFWHLNISHVPGIISYSKQRKTAVDSNNAIIQYWIKLDINYGCVLFRAWGESINHLPRLFFFWKASRSFSKVVILCTRPNHPSLRCSFSHVEIKVISWPVRPQAAFKFPCIVIYQRSQTITRTQAVESYMALATLVKYVVILFRFLLNDSVNSLSTSIITNPEQVPIICRANESSIQLHTSQPGLAVTTRERPCRNLQLRVPEKLFCFLEKAGICIVKRQMNSAWKILRLSIRNCWFFLVSTVANHDREKFGNTKELARKWLTQKLKILKYCERNLENYRTFGIEIETLKSFDRG